MKKRILGIIISAIATLPVMGCPYEMSDLMEQGSALFEVIDENQNSTIQVWFTSYPGGPGYLTDDWWR